MRGLAGPKLNVLIVADEAALGRSVSSALGAAGHSTSLAPDARTALWWIETASRRPDVLILEIELPTMVGFEVLAVVRVSDQFCDLPILGICGIRGLRAADVRVNTLLPKPINETDLVEAVQDAVDVARRPRLQEQPQHGWSKEMSDRKMTMVRYRFDTLDQLRRHLHVIDGRTLLFCRSTNKAAPMLMGPVILEIELKDTNQIFPVRSTVISRVEGVLGGVWLRLADARLFQKAAGQDVFGQRQQRRIACDLVVEVQHEDHPRIARLLDVSREGARLSGVSSVPVKARIQTRLIAPPKGWLGGALAAQVIRVSGVELGIKFAATDEASKASARSLYELVERSQEAAVQVQHPLGCCAANRVIEPPLPHVRSRL